MNFKEFVTYKEQEQFDTITSLGILIDYFEEHPDDLSILIKYFKNLYSLVYDFVKKIKLLKKYASSNIRLNLHYEFGFLLNAIAKKQKGITIDSLEFLLEKVQNVLYYVKEILYDPINKTEFNQIVEFLETLIQQIKRIQTVSLVGQHQFYLPTKRST